MKSYEVVCIAVSGLNKKVFGAGDIVTEDQFPAGHAEKYLKSGHLAAHGAVESAPVKTAQIDDKPEYESVTAAAIKAMLEERGVDISGAKSKKDLYTLL